METADDILSLPERLVPPLDRRETVFRVGLVVAVLLHAALFIEAGRSLPRTMGERSGADDAIAVELVTSADLKSLESVASPPAGAPAPPPTAAPQPQPEPPPPEPAPEPTPEAAAPTPPPTPAEPVPKQEQKPPEEQPQEKPAEQKSAVPDFESLLPDLATIPQPTEEPPQKAEEAKPAEPPKEAAKPAEKKSAQPEAKKRQKQARLDPSPSAPPGRSAAATRPPGITRSGENDEFGRGVIRALRQTMPPPRGVFGQVTVRLTLNENGDLVKTEVLSPSRTSIDQEVLFAVKQSYFPLPPYKSTIADRTFIITYVYR